MKSIYMTDFNNGATLIVNLRLDKNSIQPIEPSRNAVIVDYLKVYYDEMKEHPTLRKHGWYLRPIITIECMDMEMLEELQKQASIIFKAHVKECDE